MSSYPSVCEAARANMAEYIIYIDGLVQERRNSSALAMELRLSWTKPSIYKRFVCPTTDELGHKGKGEKASDTPLSEMMFGTLLFMYYVVSYSSHILHFAVVFRTRWYLWSMTYDMQTCKIHIRSWPNHGYITVTVMLRGRYGDICGNEYNECVTICLILVSIHAES